MSYHQSADTAAFHNFELAGWEANVSEYDAAFARVTSQAIAPLLDAVGLHKGMRLLDVASGPGTWLLSLPRKEHRSRVLISRRLWLLVRAAPIRLSIFKKETRRRLRFRMAALMPWL